MVERHKGAARTPPAPITMSLRLPPPIAVTIPTCGEGGGRAFTKGEGQDARRISGDAHQRRPKEVEAACPCRQRPRDAKQDSSEVIQETDKASSAPLGVPAVADSSCLRGEPMGRGSG